MKRVCIALFWGFVALLWCLFGVFAWPDAFEKELGNGE